MAWLYIPTTQKLGICDVYMQIKYFATLSLTLSCLSQPRAAARLCDFPPQLLFPLAVRQPTEKKCGKGEDMTVKATKNYY